MFDLTGKITPRENYLRLIKGDNPQYLCHNAVYSQGMFMDALALNNRFPKEGDESEDGWGVQYKWPAGEPGPVPMVTEKNRVIKDIRKWDKYLNVPWPSKLNIRLDRMRQAGAEFDRKNYLILGSYLYGALSSVTHNLMGFEDALVNYIEERRPWHAARRALTNTSRILKHLIDHTHPDMNHIHDDWGSKKKASHGAGHVAGDIEAALGQDLRLYAFKRRFDPAPRRLRLRPPRPRYGRNRYRRLAGHHPAEQHQGGSKTPGR
jgi:hypothetical protein